LGTQRAELRISEHSSPRILSSRINNYIKLWIEILAWVNLSPTLARSCAQPSRQEFWQKTDSLLDFKVKNVRPRLSNAFVEVLRALKQKLRPGADLHFPCIYRLVREICPDALIA
jgi:hypothetical protein